MSFLLEDGEDLLDTINFINEFEADGQTSEPEEDEEFSMDDEGEEATPAADTGEETPAEDSEEEEYSMDDEEEYSMDDEGEEESQEGNEEEPEGEENTEDEEYEIPDEEGGENTEGDTEGGNEEFSMDDEGTPGDDTDSNDMGEDNSMGSDEPNSKLKDLETVVFDNLSEPEKKLKIKELKELFIQVHMKCGTIADKVTDLKTDEETIQIAEYISTTLIDLQKYIDDYINNIFDTKTYIENIAHLQKYITIFNAIGTVFAEINRENSK